MIYFFALLLMVVLWFVPWWFGCILSFAFGFLRRSTFRSGLECFVATFFVIAAVAMFLDSNVKGLASERLSKLLHLPSSSFTYLISAFVISLPFTLFAISGALLRKESPKES